MSLPTATGWHPTGLDKALADLAQHEAKAAKMPVIGAMCVVGRHGDCDFDACECKERRLDYRGYPCHEVHEFAITHGGPR